ncbi:MAG: C-GCAxxG-C-C family protein [Oscillospiraceae bacterium]|nr:C-GCAxxG-C-C family protein [Oscillospiraceae bacterium]
MADYLINKEVPYFGEEGLSCSQSTLRLLIERGVLDLPMDTVKLMTYLHGNKKRDAHCGAVNAAAVALGAEFGFSEVGGHLDRRGYVLMEEFLVAFEEKFGNVRCQELVGKTVRERVDGQWTCAEYVVWAAGKVEELIKKGREMENPGTGDSWEE